MRVFIIFISKSWLPFRWDIGFYWIITLLSSSVSPCYWNKFSDAIKKSTNNQLLAYSSSFSMNILTNSILNIDAFQKQFNLNVKAKKRLVKASRCGLFLDFSIFYIISKVFLIAETSLKQLCYTNSRILALHISMDSHDLDCFKNCYCYTPLLRFFSYVLYATPHMDGLESERNLQIH